VIEPVENCSIIELEFGFSWKQIVTYIEYTKYMSQSLFPDKLFFLFLAVIEPVENFSNIELEFGFSLKQSVTYITKRSLKIFN